ncbi:MAG: sensor histidine kinase [Desulfobacterales bacterium]|nr:sensor histidine kinase [Desulfobacterales bacterium]
MTKEQFKPDMDNAVCKIPDEFFKEIDIEFLIHELKDPIAVIEAGVRSLLEKQEKFGELAPRQERTLNRAMRNCVKARGMLHGLLEIGRSESKQFCGNQFKPAAIIFDILEESLVAMSGKFAEALSAFNGNDDAMQFLHAQGFELTTADRAAGAVAFQDEQKFRQIAGNLIKNAIHHRNKKVQLNLDADDDWLCLEVADDGPGIDPRHHAHVFQRYTQIRDTQNVTRRGHGLGLAGAYIIARHLGGDIKIKSEKGKGAVFYLYLPLNIQCVAH